MGCACSGLLCRRCATAEHLTLSLETCAVFQLQTLLCSVMPVCDNQRTAMCLASAALSYAEYTCHAYY